MWKFKKEWTGILIVLISLLSFFRAEYFSTTHPTLNFYSLPTRGWELMIGALFAFYSTQINTLAIRKYSQILSLIGISLILFSIFFYNDKTPYPSTYTLAPTIGSGLVLVFATKETMVNKLLSLRFFIYLGLISYSAYLWHQPVLVFFRHFSLTDLTLTWSILAISLTLTMSHLTWRYIEKPFRSNLFIPTKIFVSIALIILIALLAFGLYFVNNPYTGLTGAQHEKSLSLENYKDDLWNSNKKKFDELHLKPRLLIIGDSYAQDFHKGLYLYLGNNFNNLDIVTIGINRRCRNVLETTSNLKEHLFKSDTGCWVDEKRIGNPEYDLVIRNADLIIVRSYWDELPTTEMPRLYDYIYKLAEGKVLFLGATIFGTFRKGSKFYFLNETSRILNPSDVMPYSIQPKFSSVQLVSLAKSLMLDRNYIDTQSIFCKSEIECNAYDMNGNLLTPDGHHLTNDGKLLMIKTLFHTEPYSTMWNKFISNQR